MDFVVKNEVSGQNEIVTIAPDYSAWAYGVGILLFIAGVVITPLFFLFL